MSYLPDEVGSPRRDGVTEPGEGTTDRAARRGRHRKSRSERRDSDGGPETTDRSPTMGRFLGLTALGSVVPGAGLLATGRRRLGGALLGLFVLVLLAALVFLLMKGPTAAALFVAVRPRWLLGLSVGVVVGVLLVCASVVATGWSARVRPAAAGRRAAMVGWVGLLCAILLLPAVRTAEYAFIQRDLLQSVFNPKNAVSARGPNADNGDPWAAIPRVNVLLVGSDAYPDRPGIRTDSMMAVSVNTRTGDTVLFGIPRNLQGYTFRPTNPLHKYYPEGPRCGLECMLNGVWHMATQRAAEFPGNPNPGLSTLTEVVSDLLGMPIDNTVVIDIRGFSALVDAMGGVSITVRDRLPIGGKLVNGYIVPGSITGWIEPGPQHMNGYTAMWFARSRVLSDDFDRMRRQRCMVGALVRQVNPLTMINRFPALAQVAKDNIQADVDMAQLPAWADLVTRAQRGSIRSLPFTSKLINVNNPDYPKIHRMVARAVTQPSQSASPSSARSATTPTAPADATATTGTPVPSASTSTPAEGLVNVSDAC